MRVSIGERDCNGDGICADICPQVFRMNGNSIAVVIVEKVPEKYREICREAAEICPESCIHISE
jgi:ferredoxin